MLLGGTGKVRQRALNGPETAADREEKPDITHFPSQGSSLNFVQSRSAIR